MEKIDCVGCVLLVLRGKVGFFTPGEWGFFLGRLGESVVGGLTVSSHGGVKKSE